MTHLPAIVILPSDNPGDGVDLALETSLTGRDIEPDINGTLELNSTLTREQFRRDVLLDNFKEKRPPLRKSTNRLRKRQNRKVLAGKLEPTSSNDPDFVHIRKNVKTFPATFDEFFVKNRYFDRHVKRMRKLDDSRRR